MSAKRVLLCAAWAPWGEARGYQLRLAMVAEALAQLATLDVCLLDTRRAPELDGGAPDFVHDAEWFPVDANPHWSSRVVRGGASPVREATLRPGADRALRDRFLAPPPDLTWCVEPRGFDPVVRLVGHPLVLDLQNVHSA